MFAFFSLSGGETVKAESTDDATVDEAGTWFSTTLPEIGIFSVIVNISVTICELVEGILSTTIFPYCLSVFCCK